HARHPANDLNWCTRHGYDAATRLSEALNRMEPSGPKGQVRVGYEMGIDLLGLYERQDGAWKINRRKVDAYLGLVQRIDRPVVIYLMANHFSSGPLARSLARDPQNLMWLANDQPPIEDYFGHTIIPFTLSVDPSIPVNRYRFHALRYVAHRLDELPAKARRRIVAITLAGEVQQIFSNFVDGGNNYGNIQVTDYSPRSVDGFRWWLRGKYRGIARLNRAMGSRFRDFAAISPPTKALDTGAPSPFTEVYNALSAGEMPISGWLWDPKSLISDLRLYVDGAFVGLIPRGFNRLDVYQAVPAITDPNVGFRYNLDYRRLSLGPHTLAVVAQSKGGFFLIGKRRIVVMRRGHGRAAALKGHMPSFGNEQMLSGVRSWLDMPKAQSILYYNPLARQWNAYRNYQVAAFLKYFWLMARRAGLPVAKLFTHQIFPRVNSDWNPDLYAVDASLGPNVPYHLGINLYGGATNSRVVRSFLRRHRIHDYGVPEFHPQDSKRPNASLRALLSQYRSGARFVSPYYVSIKIGAFAEKGGLHRFLIRPDNPSQGSQYLYAAIIQFAKY
ncbi:MAG: beta-galactosidase, partial [Betaproteobacteria bacterium]|nr:beta-galactosidase [Betaproteobacteria bacterium]